MDVLVLGVSFCVDLFHLEIAGADAVFGVYACGVYGMLCCNYVIYSRSFLSLSFLVKLTLALFMFSGQDLLGEV